MRACVRGVVQQARHPSVCVCSRPSGALEAKTRVPNAIETGLRAKLERASSTSWACTEAAIDTVAMMDPATCTPRAAR